MPLTKHIEAARDMHKILQESNDNADSMAVYARGCSSHERVADLLEEARAHGSIVAMKGEAVVIMPKLVDGWRQIYGRRRTDLLTSVCEHME